MGRHRVPTHLTSALGSNRVLAPYCGVRSPKTRGSSGLALAFSVLPMNWGSLSLLWSVSLDRGVTYIRTSASRRLYGSIESVGLSVLWLSSIRAYHAGQRTFLRIYVRRGPNVGFVETQLAAYCKCLNEFKHSTKLQVRSPASGCVWLH